MAHEDDEVTNPGRGHQSGGFEEESEGTEEVTQVDSHSEKLDPDQLTPVDPDLLPLDEDTLIPQ